MMKTKTLCIMVLLVGLFVFANAQIVSAQDTDIPVIEEVSFTDGGATEISELEMAKPVNIVPNELLLLVICSDNDGDATYFNAVAGWTKLGESGNSICDSHIAVYYQVANGSQVNTNITGITTSNMLGWILRISGVDTNDTIEASNFAASVAAGTDPQIIPSVTTFTTNTLVLYGLSFDGGDGYPMNVVSPYFEITDRTNTGTPTAAYASGCIGYRELEFAGDSMDTIVYTANVDGASFFQIAINGDVPTVATTATTGFFYDIFLSTDIWGWFGPLSIIVISFVILSNKKYRPLGIFFLIVESLLAYQYVTLAVITPWYWWNFFIMIFGVIACMGQMVGK